MQETEGYVVVCVGDIYEQLLLNFEKTLRHFGDKRPIKVIREDELKAHRLFDSCRVQNERYSILPKISMDEFAPFDHNIHIDVDALCCGDTEYVWNFLKNQDQFILHRGWDHDSDLVQKDWFPGWAQRVEKAHGEKVCVVQGAFQYYRKRDSNPDFFNFLRDDIWAEYEYWMATDDIIETHHRNSRSDQCMFGLAYPKFGLAPISMTEEPIMTRIMHLSQFKPPYYHIDSRGGNTGKTFDIPVAFTHVEQLFQPGKQLGLGIGK